VNLNRMLKKSDYSTPEDNFSQKKQKKRRHSISIYHRRIFSFEIYIYICIYMVNTHLIGIVRYAKYLLVPKRSIDSKNVCFVCAEVRAFVRLFAFVHLLSE
jgi:hypothetical protein